MSKNKQIIKANSLNLLDVNQAAAFLKVSVSTIRRWSQSKKVTGLKLGIRGDWRFTEKELLKMLKSNDGKPINNI